MIDVKLNNRKTKKVGEKKDDKNATIKIDSTIPQSLTNKIKNNKNTNFESVNNIKVKNNSRFKMPDRRKGYIQKSQIGDNKVYLSLR